MANNSANTEARENISTDSESIEFLKQLYNFGRIFLNQIFQNKNRQQIFVTTKEFIKWNIPIFHAAKKLCTYFQQLYLILSVICFAMPALSLEYRQHFYIHILAYSVPFAQVSMSINIFY